MFQKATSLLSTRLLLLFALFVLTACAPVAPGAAQPATDTSATAKPVELRIGYQRGGAWTILKAQGTLEKRFGPNVTVTWTLFPAGPPLLEAMNAGSLDIGPTGETPPIFAQAAGTPLVYVAAQSGSGAGSGILVPADSPLQAPTDLKGKKIAFTKASSAHLLLIKALAQQKLQYSEIEPVFLAPPEARAAFQSGSIDAWVVWNPFREAAVQELNARELINGGTVAPTKGYILAANTFTTEHPDLLLAIIEELQKVQLWANDNVEAYAAILEKETEIPASVWIASHDQEATEYALMDEATVTYQQEVADIFYGLQLIPEPLQIKDVVWFGPED
ncbi:MAG: aliphatic sulfonate ABC transporter substrate-binding protein [Caldilineaceae bacterium]